MPSRAGFWIRLLALVIDLVALTFILLGAEMVALEVITSGPVEDRVIAPLMLGLMLIYTSFEIWTAATPGKILFRLRITEQDGTPAELWRRVLRWSTKWLGFILAFLFDLTNFLPLDWFGGFCNFIVLIGCFFALNEDRLTWHDQWAHTAVCRVPRAYRSFDVIVPPPLPPGSS